MKKRERDQISISKQPLQALKTWKKQATAIENLLRASHSLCSEVFWIVPLQ